MTSSVDVVHEFIDEETETLFIEFFEHLVNNGNLEGTMGQLHAVRIPTITYVSKAIEDRVYDLEQKVSAISVMNNARAEWMVSYDPSSYLSLHRDGDHDSPFRVRVEFPTAILNMNNEVDAFHWGDELIHMHQRDLIVGDGYKSHGFFEGAIVDETKTRYSILFREG